MNQSMIDRTSHADIVQNPDVKAFLDSCKYMVPPSGNEIANIISDFVRVPEWNGTLPSKIIAIDGSNYEATVNPNIPFTRFGFVKIGNLLINREEFQGLSIGKFVDPFRVAEISRDNSSLLFSFPSTNMSYKNEQNVRSSFRLALDEALYKQRFIEKDPNTSFRSTLFYIASYRTGNLRSKERNRIILHKCPSCGRENVEVWDIPETQRCPYCGEPIYPSDSLRIWEEVEDGASNQLALTRFTNVMTHMLVIHYLRYIKEHFPNSYLKTISNVCFFIDGPLSINGNAAWVKSCVQKILFEINEELEQAGLPLLMVVGLVKSGKLFDYINLIGQSIPVNSILGVTDKFRNDYVDFNKTPSNTTYGNETYYGQDFLLRTGSGKLFIFDAPYPFPNKENLPFFIREKANIDNYSNIGAYVKLIEDFETDLYESTVVPLALAQKYTAISLKPGGKVLDILTQKAIERR